ncbi:protein of unknown function [Taphrina deformans PYCC 5710]|uniref:PH domain-containing protein n=1 Tax=Taphrina deformans (strain PYCC 5710 / ATCC 11124 / CBS 356.35 / IMI 108563 / JCM 9778 / NBRC 8474) TaxID=1097556 RepID=R4XM19_TAPDE|nr:protein of unknown function [Taphrina deformans PYCC 5710]|eukprot:CCG84340.1 protein of unknown function [Taphrina deformans PYCC 5710]
MSAAENVRSFWLAKTRTESPASIPRFKEGPTMEGLRSTLQKNKSWQTASHGSRTSTSKPTDLSSNTVPDTAMKERDHTLSPTNSPTFGRPSPFAKDTMGTTENIDATTFTRPSSPHKSAMASPELGPRTLARAKSVTFNESLEVRHMSECSFEEPSSPYSATYGTDDNECSLDELSDVDDDDDDVPQRWGDNATLPDLRAPPSIAGPRPLPSVPVPVKLADSPETRLLATEQENLRKPFSGLGLNLASPPREQYENERLETVSTYNADEAMIRRNSQIDSAKTDTSDNFDADNHIGTLLTTARVRELNKSATDESEKTGRASPWRASPTLTNIVSRSPEPAISREHIKEKLAQRNAAKESARLEQKCDALTPHQILAPPLPHYDSFVRATAADNVSTSSQDSSNDSVSTAIVVPQRKVSDTHRPATPIEKITDSPPEPQSGRAVHHDREKRVSIDMSHVKPPPAPASFTAINYDGDDYDDSDVEEFIDEPVIYDLPQPTIAASQTPEPEPAIETEQLANLDRPKVEKGLENIEDSPLRFLQDIPDVPEQHEPQVVLATPDATTFNMKHMSLSLDFDALGEDSLGMGLEQYMTPELRPETPITSRTVACESPGKSQKTKSQLDVWVETTEGPNKENSTKPELATITARGLKLRTRPSITPADATALAARRRQVSLELENHDQAAYGHEVELFSTRGGSVGDLSLLSDKPHSPANEDQLDNNSDSDELTDSIQPMAMPVLQPLTREFSFSDINNAFDRVMQKQKKGYVVRQQTRVVHATANTDDSEQANQESSKGHTRQSSSVYTTASDHSSRISENHKTHSRKGSRVPVGVQMSPKPPSTTAVPTRAVMVENLDGGRLFIRVMHVKRLTLPIPKGEESFFSCTLDNGKHCVTTPMHRLAETVKINQEFELIADHNLEFILTLQAQYVPPKLPVRPKSTLGRLLNSPKRHKPTGSITSLSLAGHVGDDGSFARAHLALKHFRSKAFGRPYTMLVPVLNEWAMETTGLTSKNVPQVRQRKPYKIGEIELQVLYVPPVVADQRQALPTSLSQAVRDIRDAEWHTALHCEGYLSQQGGDCPYWRRRHFKLVGSKLTAYHANTGQVRATINLAKATHVTDDKESLTRAEVTIGKGENQKRRKSGFAEREEGHLYVADGFRIRFVNGEMIDFYADSHEEKNKWVNILGGIVQKIPVAKAWCQIVLEAESGVGGMAK